MNWTETFHVAYQLLALLAAIVLGGFALTKGCAHSKPIAWVVAVAGPFSAYMITIGQSPIIIMTALILALLLSMKAVVALAEARPAKLNFQAWLVFSLAWLGMRPSVFQRLGDAPLHGATRLIRKGAIRFAAGLLLFAIAHFLWNFTPAAPLGPIRLLLVLGLLFPALSLMLHFGFLNMLTGFWRWRGAPVTNLFNAPFKAHTLGDFWGRRWNLAFAEMTAIAVFRPLRKRYNDGIARGGAFIFSGFAHELAISVPVNAGYGLPTAYFCLQALGMHLERRYQLNGQLWTALWVLIPAPILFHTEFIVEILLPLLEIKV